MRHDHLFAFESDFVATLRCVPMAVRFKLDQVGIKLTLRQWSRFTDPARKTLLLTACESREEQQAYRAMLEAMVREATGETAQALPPTDVLSWDGPDGPPPAIIAFAETAGVQLPSSDDWRKLAELERFALVKLSRDNHDNVNFIPAMREFGLLAAPKAPTA